LSPINRTLMYTIYYLLSIQYDFLPHEYDYALSLSDVLDALIYGTMIL
jgi:hypothetical protein